MRSSCHQRTDLITMAIVDVPSTKACWGWSRFHYKSILKEFKECIITSAYM